LFATTFKEFDVCKESFDVDLLAVLVIYGLSSLFFTLRHNLDMVVMSTKEKLAALRNAP
jgi:hypothetical protein